MKNIISIGIWVLAILFVFTGNSIAGWGDTQAFYPGAHMMGGGYMGSGYMGWSMIFFWAILLVILILVVRCVITSYSIHYTKLYDGARAVFLFPCILEHFGKPFGVVGSDVIKNSRLGEPELIGNKIGHNRTLEGIQETAAEYKGAVQGGVA